MSNRSFKFRVFSVVFALIFVMTFPLTVVAESITVIRPIDVINLYHAKEDFEYEIVRQKNLLSISGGSDYTLYELSPYGYAILFNETNGLMEACYSEDVVPPVSMTDNLQYYYGGPGIYCIKDNNSFFNLFDGTYLDNDVLSTTILLESETQGIEMKKADDIIMTSGSNIVTRGGSTTYSYLTHSVEYNYFADLVDYGNNVNDTCTVIATAMLLGYYDRYANEKFVPTEYESGSGTSEAFHQLLNDYVYGDSQQKGIFIHDAATGINEYLSSHMLSCVLESQYSSASDARNSMLSRLQSGEPVIASMGTIHGALYDHSVLVYRVTYDSANPIPSAVFTMNMGWHSGPLDGQSRTEYVASASWFYECGYIKNTCESHSYVSNWQDYNGAYHYRNCANCTQLLFESHSERWNSILGRCMACGHEGYYQEILSTRPMPSETE